MTLSPATLAGFTIETTAQHDALDQAARELRLHLARIPAAATRGVIRLSASAGPGDAFTVTVAPNEVRIAGANPRGALNGAFWLLEQAGFSWLAPGGDGTRFTPGRVIPLGVHEHAPAFARRTLILGCDALHDDWPAWLQFASRNRLNDIFFHDTPPSRLDRAGALRPATYDELAADGRGWLFERWDADGPAIRAAASHHGMTIQFGGHHLPSLLPRELFAGHPDWFPLRNGERNPRYNLCTSSDGAIAALRSAARAFFERFPGADVYHLWADDIRGGGWCECDRCASLSPSDQALRATNVLADVLAEVAPPASVAHLAYHDTIEPPAAVVPAPNVVALYAPRPRSYAFAIDDPACPRNASGHWQPFLGLRKTFGDASRVHVFEYYSDAILYRWLAPLNFEVLPADLRAYAGAGVTTIEDLAVTPRPWRGPAWHAWWFARAAWDPQADPNAVLHAFCEAAFESDAPAFEQAFLALEDGYRLLLDLGELQQIPRHDILDFSDTPREALAAKGRQMERALDHFHRAARSIPLAPAGMGMAAREELAIVISYATHLANRVIAWDAALAGDRAGALAAIADARTALSATEDWCQRHLTPAHANLAANMLRAARYHTGSIETLIGAITVP